MGEPVAERAEKEKDVPRDSRRRNILAGAIGNALEWYDFSVYGFLAPILGTLFFPAGDAVASLMAAFGAFAVGYAARPIGGVLFGHLGDRAGRKTALVVSVLLMGVSTCGIGVLPDDGRIGAAAAVLLVLFRIMQGLSVGGEFSGSIILLAEHAPPKRRGLDAAWTQVGALSGFLLGSGVGALVSSALGEEAMHAWGWRVPFLFGAVIAVAGLLFRRNLAEPPAARRLDRAAGLPIVVAVRDHWRAMVRLIALLLGGTIGFYMIFVYAASYLTAYMHFSTARALDISSVNLFFMLVVMLPLAALSDRIGRKPMLLASSLGVLFLAWPLWWLIHQDALVPIIAGQLGFALLFSLPLSTIGAVMAELLPPEVRCSGASVAYNLCVGLFGGTTPLVATYLIVRTQDDFAPVYYLMAAAAIQLAAVAGLKDLAGKPLPWSRS
jgi:MFS transporter, MHS family, proline/betaine transporter